MPRKEKHVSLDAYDRLHLFGAEIKKRRMHLGMSQRELARSLASNLAQSSLSRIENGIFTLTPHVATEVMRSVHFTSADTERWLSTLFAVPPPIEPERLELIRSQLFFHLHRGIREHPRHSASFGTYIATELEKALQYARRRDESEMLRFLAQQARLLEAWGMICYVPFSEYDSPIAQIEAVIAELAPTHEHYLLGKVVINSAMMMKTRQPADLDELQWLLARKHPTNSFAVALMYEEVAREYLHSAEHTYADINAVIEDGRRYCAHDPLFIRNLLRLDALAPLAAYAKGDDMFKAATDLHHVSQRLRQPLHLTPDVLIETLTLEGRIYLVSGKHEEQGARLLQEAFDWARQSESSTGMAWLLKEAKRHHVSLNTTP